MYVLRHPGKRWRSRRFRVFRPPTSRRDMAVCLYNGRPHLSWTGVVFTITVAIGLLTNTNASIPACASTCMLYLSTALREQTGLLRSVQRRLDGVAARLCIAEQHLGVGSVEHRVRDVRISTCFDLVSVRSTFGKVFFTRDSLTAHATLHDNDLLALVSVDDRHSCDRAVKGISKILS